MSRTTGAAFGRAGGRASGGGRAQKALGALMRVKFVGPANNDGCLRPSNGTSAAPPRVSQTIASAPKTLEALGMLAEQAAVEAAAAAAAYAVAQDNQSGSSNGVAAPKSAAKAKRALTSAGTPATKQKKPKPGGGLPSAIKRGDQVIVELPSRNAAHNDYTFEDVCELGARIAAGEVKLPWCDRTAENGARLYKVPQASMQRW